MLTWPSVFVSAVGTILLACFSREEGAPGLFYGGGELFWRTLVVMILAIGFFIVGSGICFFMADKLITLRAPLDAELMGLDASTHGERWHVSLLLSIWG